MVGGFGVVMSTWKNESCWIPGVPGALNAVLFSSEEANHYPALGQPRRLSHFLVGPDLLPYKKKIDLIDTSPLHAHRPLTFGLQSLHRVFKIPTLVRPSPAPDTFPHQMETAASVVEARMKVFVERKGLTAAELWRGFHDLADDWLWAAGQES